MWQCSCKWLFALSICIPVLAITKSIQVHMWSQTSASCSEQAYKQQMLCSQTATCIVLGMICHPVAAIVNLKGRFERHAGKWMDSCSRGGKKNLWFRDKAVCARQDTPLTLGSILVFFRLRHFSAHRSQFGCVIPDLGKNRNSLISWRSSMKSVSKVLGSEIRALWGEEKIILILFTTKQKRLEMGF